MWEGGTHTAGQLLQRAALVHCATGPAKGKAGEQPPSSWESFFLFSCRNFVAGPKETFSFPLENRVQSPREMACVKITAGITGEMSIQSELQLQEPGSLKV